MMNDKLTIISAWNNRLNRSPATNEIYYSYIAWSTGSLHLIFDTLEELVRKYNFQFNTNVRCDDVEKIMPLL